MAWILSLALAAGVSRHGTGAAVLFLILVVVAARRRRATGWLLAGLVAACALVGHGAATRLDGDEAAVRRVAARQGAALVTLDGVVTGYSRTGRHGTTFDFDTRVDGRPVRLEVRAAFFDVSYGDRLVLRGRLSAPSPEDGSRLRARGLSGRARVRLRDAVCTGRDDGCPLLREVLWPLHRYARTRLARAMGEDASLPLGLLLGERGTMEEGERAAVLRLGIAHLLAISGMHLTAIAACVVFLSRGIPRASLALVLLAISVYTGAVGDVESLTRAYLMVLWAAAATALIRPVRLLDALGMALLAMALVRPTALHAIGLQLSFAATFALVVVMPALPRGGGAAAPRVRRMVGAVCRPVAGAFLVSVAVEVFIAPLQLHHFGSISVVGPLATVLFFVPVTAILLASALVVILSVVPAAGAAGAGILAAASRATLEAVELAGRASPAQLVLPEPAPWIYYPALALGWRWRRRWYGWLLAAAGVAASFAA